MKENENKPPEKEKELRLKKEFINNTPVGEKKGMVSLFNAKY